MEVCVKGQPITFVEHGTPAEKAGVRCGDVLLRINETPVLDLIDYEALTARRALKLDLLRAGEPLSIVLHKGEYEPLGLCFETTLMSRMMTCRNHCVFCFIDQMPKGVRSSLNVKDDDWRMSFIMGNYVTLTNVSDAEFARIIERRVSPLYVSVHATDPEVRTKIMRNPTAGRIMERLTALKEAGLRFHTQIVLCRGLNDGEILERTLFDLSSLAPECASIAIVPVGVTKYREGLTVLGTFDAEQSRRIIETIEPKQKEYLARFGTRLVFLSDEWYLNAGIPLPEPEAYEEYGQIENGVGLLRMFEEDFRYALSERAQRSETKRISIAGGTAAYPFFRELYRELAPYGIETDLHPIPNLWFGGNVHVAGLVTGSDLITELKGKPLSDPLLIPKNMLRETEDVFLDGMTLHAVETALGVRIKTFTDGTELISCLFEE
jgi:putative radical SAM enzyme (TIGR03279 family)